ncbi:MAG TPA: TadE/TadG family type IV pilus assembly protein [Gemmatimonadales bacterium]|nr:TadE/TadG family type IV pilus assembly protein [Gemmatimonadales bacterium]
MPTAFLRNRRGGVLVFVAIGTFILLGISGLALDGGLAYLTRAKLARAVDAGSLAGARTLRQGKKNAETEAYAVAAANGVKVEGTTTLSLEFGTNAKLQQTVLMRAHRTIPLMFARVLGHTKMTIGAVAEATVPPIDMVVVVDRSGSLEAQKAWVPLQNAVKDFVRLFDEDIDQLGLTSFQVRANDEVLLTHQFKGAITSGVSGMNANGDTNTGEGLRLASEQLRLPNVRPGAAKVVVFFTDGRPTAFRGTMGGADRVIAVSPSDDNKIRGYFDNPLSIPMNKSPTPDGCAGAATCFGTWDEASVRSQARKNGETAAEAIRTSGAFLYTIALGNPGAVDPLLQPDQGYLEGLANVNHKTNPVQPAGRSYFAPSADQLDNVFKELAKDLLVRLSR